LARPTIDHYVLHRAPKIGGEHIGFTRSTETVHIAGEEWSVEDWVAVVERIDSTLKQEGWVAKTKDGNPAPWERSSNAFLIENLDKINKRDRGKIEEIQWVEDRLSWFVRWLFRRYIAPHLDAVVTKEKLSGYD
jgi:hypothetical protein